MPYRRRTPYPTSVIGPNRLSDGPIATAPCQVPDREQLILHIVEDKRLMESGNGQTVTGHHDRARMSRIFGPATDEAKKAISGIAQLARMKRAVPLQHLDRFKVALRRLPRFEGMAHQISVPSVKVAQRISCDERHDEAATQVRCQKLLTDELVCAVAHWRYADAIMVRQGLHHERRAGPQYSVQNILFQAPIDTIRSDRFRRHRATSPYS